MLKDRELLMKDRKLLSRAETPAALDAPADASRHTGVVGGGRGVVLLGEETAVGTLGNTVLLDHEGVEEVALQGAVAQPASP